MVQNSKILVWDLDTIPNIKDRYILSWSGSIETENILSVSKFVESNALNLRAKYLSWIFDLSNVEFDGKTLLNNLLIRDDFSFWWMTLLSEKCNYDKSIQIDDVIKFFGFLEWIKDKDISCVEIASSNSALIKCICQFCTLKKIQVKNRNKRFYLFQTIKSFKFFTFIYTLLWTFFYFLKNYKLFKEDKSIWKDNSPDITFISYLFNIDSEALKKNIYKSQYWGTLPEQLGKTRKTNWLHIFVHGGIFRDFKEAEVKLKKLNHLNNEEQCHILLESFLSFKVMISSYFDWFKVISKYRLIKNSIIKNTFQEINLFPFFEKDCTLSVYGINGFDNLMKLNLLESVFLNYSNKSIGVYLHENQGWESALNYTWNINSDNNLIAVPHSTIRFWDLRYYYDVRLLRDIENRSMPIPKILACNGEIAINKLLESGFNPNNLVKVESLRYMKLVNELNNISKQKKEKQTNYNLLVLGDYQKNKTYFQLNLLEKSFVFVQKKYNIIFKPHPATNIELTKFPGLNIQNSSEQIEVLLDWADVTFSSESTSASVDAYIRGKQVLIASNPKKLNLSPLKDFKNVLFINNPKDLASSLNSFTIDKMITNDKDELFYTDHNLSKWKSLLAFD